MYGQGMMGPMGGGAAGGNPMIQNLMKMRADKMSTLNDQANTESHQQAVDTYANAMNSYQNQVRQADTLLNQYQAQTDQYDEDYADYLAQMDVWNDHNNYYNHYGRGLEVAWAIDHPDIAPYVRPWTSYKNDYNWNLSQDPRAQPPGTQPSGPQVPAGIDLTMPQAPSFSYTAPDPYSEGIRKADRVINSGLFKPFGLGSQYGSAMMGMGF
jgi:hypothetical protein